MKNADADIDLALTSLSENDTPQITSALPNDYICKDRADKGWGLLVIRPSEESAINSIDNAIVSYLEGLEELREIICSSSPILQIGVYNRMATYKFKLKSFKLLSNFDINLEVSIYPTNDE